MDHHVCPWWLAYTFDNPLRRLVHNRRKLLAPYVHGGMTVADIGCGMGYFTVEMARLLTGEGRVIAVELQEKMLSITMKRAVREGVAGRVLPCHCKQDDLRLDEPIDFALAFWVVHEVPDREGFFRQVRDVLKPGGYLLMAEPRFHVSKDDVGRSIAVAQSHGLSMEGSPKIFFSRTALFRCR